MNNKPKEYYYFQVTVNNLITHPLILLLFLIVEYLTIYSNLLITISQIISNKPIQDDPLHYFSLYNITKKYLYKDKIIPFVSFVFLIFCIILY